jgi:hypothetical protein
VVVTGSYHAAVFALAQGVPVVGLARSGYYVDKLHGLAERFETGVSVVSLDAPALERELEHAVREWWDADELELAALPATARRQVDESRAAWRRLPALLGGAPVNGLAPRRPSVRREMVVERLEASGDDGTAERASVFRWVGGERRVAIGLPAGLAGPEYDASPFLPLALLPAMMRGDDVVVDGPVSPRLLRGAHEVAELYRAWAPELRVPEIRVAEERVPEADGDRAIGAFFSRGVDSTYSAAVERSYPGPLERLVFVRGFDPNLSDAVLDEEVGAAHWMAERLGLPLSVVSTNVHDFTRLFVSNWEDIVGSALAAMALAASGGFRALVVPSTDSTRTLGPNGTSPVLEPLLSTEATAVVHDAVVLGRAGKALWLGRNRPDLLRELKVCFASPDAGNCGRCSKCVTIMAALRSAGTLGEATRFPPELDLELVRRQPARVHARIEYLDLVDDLEDGHDPELREALLQQLQRPMWTYPGQPARRDTPGFRQRDGARLVAVVRDGLSWPPAEPDAAPPGLGLVRAVDRARGRHVYGVGRVPPGDVAGELGSLPRDQTDGLLPVYLTAGGHLVTEGGQRGRRAPAGAGAAARWAAAPLAWRGSGVDPAARVRAAATRARSLLRRGGGVQAPAPDGPLARVASIHAHPTPRRLPLFSAVHPLVGDQLLTTDPQEAADLGYGEAELLGYLDALAPVTGRLGTEPREVPWASRFGRSVTRR